MYEWKLADLKHQFSAVQANGWLPFFAAAAQKYDLPEEILLGIGSRETNLKNIMGDGGHGYGIMQIDKRSFPAWCASGKWKDPEEAIRMGAYVLRAALDSAHKWLATKYTGKYDEMRGAIAAYNAGKRVFMSYHVNGNPDLPTTGRNYSADVLARSKVFKELLGEAIKT